MKKFLKYCLFEVMEINILFVINFTVAEFIFFRAGIITVLIVSTGLTVGITIYTYRKNNDYFEQLYVKACMGYKIRDEYKNYIEIRETILTYQFNGQLNIKQNIEVLQAAIEKDKAYSLICSALLTVYGVMFGVIYGHDELMNMQMIIVYLILFLTYMEASRRIPKNTFIKKVADGIVII